MDKRYLSTLFILTLFFFKTASAGIAGLVIEQAWIAEAPPVSKVMAAYLTIRNTSSETINIIRAESESFSSIEFHETVHKDGLARMIRHDSLNIPADGELSLKRGGQHLMLFNPKKPFKAGDKVIIKLTTDNNSVETISVPVKKVRF